MTKEYLDLKLDFMFKQLFEQPTRKSITIAFLNDVLHRKGHERITNVHYNNTELIKEVQDGKTSRMDVLVTTSSGEKINVEIQIATQHDMPERVLYYWEKLFSSSIATGEEYQKLTPTIMITILNYPLFPHKTDSFHNVFHLREDTEHFIWSPHLEFHVLDLSQFMVKWRKHRRELKANPPAEMPWLMMLAAADYKHKTINNELFQELEELAVNEQEIREAMIEWEALSANRENKAHYEARMKFLRDQLSNIRGERRLGREEGFKLGVEQGKEVERIEVIGKMLNKGLKVEEIAHILECSLDEIKKAQQMRE